MSRSPERLLISRRAALVLSLLTAMHPVLAADAPAKTVRLLTVGNGFSQNATRHLDSLAKAAGHTIIHQPIVVGGASLELHWTRAACTRRTRRTPAASTRASAASSRNSPRRRGIS